MSYKYMLSVRATRNAAFVAEPGPSRFLKIPDGELPNPGHAIPKSQWVKEVLSAGTWGSDNRRGGAPRGDILLFIHGYNNDLKIITDRHSRLSKDLKEAGFKGVVVTFCWPSNDVAIGYLEDRHDAKRCAMQLVSDGISTLSERQTKSCAVNVHVLAHSTGAYIAREAFDDADDFNLENGAWRVSQMVFIGGDVSSGSLSSGNSSSESLYRHCARLTNYQSRFDSALKLSNIKRVGVAPRVGRAGIPSDAPKSQAVNVDCSAYFELLDKSKPLKEMHQAEELGSFDHSWHIGNRLFAKDLMHTLVGDMDRDVIPTRRRSESGGLELDPNGLGPIQI